MSGPRHLSRVAIVTGAGGGIGRAVASRLADEGYALLASDIDPVRLDETDRNLAQSADRVVLEADISDPVGVDRLIETVLARYGRIDALVNCAGIVHVSSVEAMTVQDWDRVMDSNLSGVFLTCRAVLPVMLAAGHGRIVNFASQLAYLGAAEYSAYAASKAAVIAFTKSLAREVSAIGVTANCVAPGPIATPMLEPSARVWTPERVASLPLGRIGRPEEVAGAVALLLHERDGALFTGQTLGPNSGDVMI